MRASESTQKPYSCIKCMLPEAWPQPLSQAHDLACQQVCVQQQRRPRQLRQCQRHRVLLVLQALAARGGGHLPPGSMHGQRRMPSTTMRCWLHRQPCSRCCPAPSPACMILIHRPEVDRKEQSSLQPRLWPHALVLLQAEEARSCLHAQLEDLHSKVRLCQTALPLLQLPQSRS